MNAGIAFVALAVAALANAQGKKSAFEVTSVKPHAFVRGFAGVPPSCSKGRFISSAPLFRLIVWAYDLKSYQLEELRAKLPAWTQQVTTSYDIEARAEETVTEAQCREMVQGLLADRFKFAAHWESKEGQVFDLVVARGGPKMKKVSETDQGNGLIISINEKPTQNPLGQVIRGLMMSDLATFIGARLDPQAPVHDKTGLDGIYKIELGYSVPRLAPKQVFRDPELEAAIEQQLGLKLDARKGLVEMLVFDHIETPDPN